MPLSVLMVSPHPSIPGGVAAYAEILKKNIKTIKVSSYYVGKPAQAENIFRIFTRFVLTPLRICSAIRKASCDIVHLNPSFNVKSLLRDGLILLAIHASCKCNVIVTFHGWNKHLSRVISNSRLLRGIVRSIFNKVSRILVLSPEFRNALLAMGIDSHKILLTRTMFENTNIQSMAVIANARPYILFMSRFDKRKGGLELLKAFLKIAHDFPDYDLVLAGDGDDRDKLIKISQSSTIKHRVFFPGYVKGEEKQKLLHNCQIFALPTYYPEGMPITLLEAMAAAKPVLTSRAGGIDQIVQNEVHGIALEVVTVEAVKSGLLKMLNNIEIYKAIGLHNAQYVKSFAAHVVAESIQQLYHEIAGRG